MSPAPYLHHGHGNGSNSTYSPAHAGVICQDGSLVAAAIATLPVHTGFQSGCATASTSGSATASTYGSASPSSSDSAPGSSLSCVYGNGQAHHTAHHHQTAHYQHDSRYPTVHHQQSAHYAHSHRAFTSSINGIYSPRWSPYGSSGAPVYGGSFGPDGHNAYSWYARDYGYTNGTIHHVATSPITPAANVTTYHAGVNGMMMHHWQHAGYGYSSHNLGSHMPTLLHMSSPLHAPTLTYRSPPSSSPSSLPSPSPSPSPLPSPSPTPTHTALPLPTDVHSHSSAHFTNGNGSHAHLIGSTHVSAPPNTLASECSTQPPLAKGHNVSTIMWKTEGTLCFLVEVGGTLVGRRLDNDMINATKLLTMTKLKWRRQANIAYGEKTKNIIAASQDLPHLSGVWIPFARARHLARVHGIVKAVYPLLEPNIQPFLYRPNNKSLRRPDNNPHTAADIAPNADQQAQRQQAPSLPSSGAGRRPPFFPCTVSQA